MSIYYFFAESFEKCIDIHFVWFIHEEKIRYELACNETKSTNGLAFAKMIPKVQGKVKQQYLKRFSLLLRDCKWAAESCPENYLHQYLFLKGTKEQLDKNYMQALTYFNEGIVNAKKGDFYLWVAVGNELAAELFIHLSQDHAAMGYIREAHYYYDRYGMMVKVHSLEQRYPQCFDDQALLKQGDATANQTLPTITTTTSAGLDFMSVIKASQTISGEIVLDKLFERMLDIVVENAGAEYVLFLEKLHNDWVVTAKLDTRQGQQKFTMLHVILKYYKELPQTIIQYALRTNEQVVLKDAASDNQYQNDPYIIRRRPKSVLCLPILHHDKTIGAIYLENNLTTGAFTQDRITVLTTLTSQFAISLENAQHFEQIEKLYRSTERFVPKQVLKLLGKEHVEDIKLGDSIKCQISALFADIRGFTTLAESMTPERITFFLNTYMKCMAPIIREHNGFVNQFLGDGILALFPEQPSDAVDAALQMHKALEEFNEFIVSKGYPEVKMGIGINSGDAMLCTLGEEERMEANVVSDVVNSASRIEGLNKFYQTGLIVSHATFELLPNKEKYLIRVLDQVKMKGKTIGTYVYEVMPLTQDDRIKYKHEYIKAFKAAFALYEMGDFTSALEAFSDCVARQPDDGVAALLKKRCEGFIRSGPPENWDGSYTLLDK